MATARLIPSTYALSSSTYLSVSNADNMYANTDSTNYATVTNSQTGTTSYYIYIRGFNFDAIPSNAVINSWTVKLKANESGVSTSSSYAPKLCNGTSQITSTCSAVSTAVTTLTFTGVGVDWEDIVDYGSNFGIRINCRRSSRNTTGYMYIYGAEILVDYTIPNPCTVATSLTGNGTISPSGVTNTYENAEFVLTITPTNSADTVIVTQDGVDVSSQLVAHYPGSTITATPDDVTTSGIQSGSSYAEYAVGHSAESPSSSGTSSNMYASSSSTGYAQYSFDFSGIPSTATIEAVEVRCYGHRESNTISTTYVSQCELFCGEISFSDTVDFPSTSNSIITLTPTRTPTRSELDDMVVRHRVGYYGGLVLGISFVVTYSTGGTLDHYTYTYTVSGDSVIAVVIGGSAASDTAYIKINGSWVAAVKVYKKVNGSWVEQSDLTSIFDSGVNYVSDLPEAPLVIVSDWNQSLTTSTGASYTLMASADMPDLSVYTHWHVEGTIIWEMTSGSYSYRDEYVINQNFEVGTSTTIVYLSGTSSRITGYGSNDVWSSGALKTPELRFNYSGYTDLILSQIYDTQGSSTLTFSNFTITCSKS